MTRGWSKSTRPISVFEQHAKGHPRYRHGRWMNRRDSDVSILEGFDSSCTNSCQGNPIEGAKDQYYKYKYQCQEELYDMKLSITIPFQEMCFGQEIVDSVVELFSGGYDKRTHGEHVREIRQKARALRHASNVGPTKRLSRLAAQRAIGNEAKKQSNKPQQQPTKAQTLREPSSRRTEESTTAYATSDSDGPTSDSDPNYETEDSAAAGLVKARWLNNYHKYKKAQEIDTCNKTTATCTGTKRLLVGKYGEGSTRRDEMRHPKNECRDNPKDGKRSRSRNLDTVAE